MYKVMIVDDESLIRRGIRNCIPWGEHGMEIVAEASNGQDALELAKQLNPDIVIADICMPELDGLEMSELLVKVNPRVKIIILTGYDEFEYAQRAVRLGAVDYILKPTNADDLLAVLEKAKRSISTERSSMVRLQEMEREMSDNMPLIRENYLIRLISGVYTPQEISGGLKILNINENPGNFQVAVLDHNSTEAGSEFDGYVEALHYAVKSICREAVDDENLGWTFYNERGQITLLLYSDSDGAQSVKQVAELMDKIQGTVNRSLKAAFSIGIGRRYQRIKDIKKSYEEAREALEQRFIMGDNCIVFIDDIRSEPQKLAWNDLIRIEKEIISGINKGNLDMVKAMVDCYFEKIKKQPSISPLWVKAKCFELAGNVILAFNDLSVKDAMLDRNLDRLYSEIYKCGSLSKAVSLLKSFIEDVMRAVTVSRNTRMRKLIEMGKEYIHKHYNEDITIPDIAGHLFLTPNYFSRIFKKETGEGCIEYINKIRMEKAKELLSNTPHLTYEIADMVGFKDANYFSLAFKKYTGLSPTEYRDAVNFHY